MVLAHSGLGSTAYPIVLGTGLTGIAISRALSAAGITHVLAGARPSGTPRLGESLNAEGSLEIARQFPELTQFFFPKRQQALFFGGHAVSFDSLQFADGRPYYSLLGFPATVQLLHVDRMGFDSAAFDEAVADEHCMLVQDRPEWLDYDAASDSIRSVQFASGRTTEAAYVFDAGNHARFVARKVGVPCHVIGKQRRVVFAHYGASTDPSGVAAPQPAWGFATSLLRLDGKKDPAEGLAWLIPLGSYVSVGVSVDPSVTRASSGGLLDWVEAAYARRGIDVTGSFASRGAAVDLTYEHYNHERCYGSNWLLAGISCCQVWFPSAAGVATGLVAARLAPDVLTNPLQTSQVYQAYMDRVAAIHAGLEWLVRDDPWSVSEEQLQLRAEAMVSSNVSRLGNYVGLEEPPAELAFSDAALRWFEQDRRSASPVRIDTANLNAQATQMFGTVGVPDPWTDAPIDVPVLTGPTGLEGPASILRLVDILSGKLGTDRSPAFVTEDVKVQIDQFSLSGLEQWIGWANLLRSATRVSGLTLTAAALTSSSVEWVLTAQWQGSIDDAQVVSPTFTMSFEVDGDRVSEIQMQRADCTFVTGDSIMPQVAFAAILGQLTDAAAVA